MTRINANIDPKELKRAHLIAELREITMVPAALRRSLRTRNPSDIAASIPKQFTLNAGHVKFHFDKMTFLKRRFESLCVEMERRGYTPDRSRAVAFDGLDSRWYNDWQASDVDNDIVRARIKQRISEKPHLYND